MGAGIVDDVTGSGRGLGETLPLNGRGLDCQSRDSEAGPRLRKAGLEVTERKTKGAVPDQRHQSVKTLGGASPPTPTPRMRVTSLISPVGGAGDAALRGCG